MSGKDYFVGWLMAAPEVVAFKITQDVITIKYADGTILTIEAESEYEEAVLEIGITEQQWDWERGNG